MYPEDCVLVGVINRKRDLAIARDEHWYRVPQARLPRGVRAEYIGFFLSGAFGSRNGGVHYYAESTGLELARRRDLLPGEANHRRADEVYYRVALGDLIEKSPPVLNPTRRPISFIYTTWDRFIHARTVSDLYSEHDYFVDRIYHALRDSGMNAERSWDAERRDTGYPAHLRVPCQDGVFTASPEANGSWMLLDSAQDDDAILAAIKAEIARHGGPVTIGIPLEGL